MIHFVKLQINYIQILLQLGNLNDCILPAVITNIDTSITFDNCLLLMRLYEIGLLCDMEDWLKFHTSANCIIFCGHLHIPPLVEIFKKFRFAEQISVTTI
jgi:hypothetical protein